MPPIGHGETFIIEPDPGKDQVRSVEWRHYADLIAQQLTSKGYVEAVGATPIKYLVFFSYGTDSGETIVASGRVVTVFTRTFELEIFDAPTFEAALPAGIREQSMQELSTMPSLEIIGSAMASAEVFETKAKSVGSEGILASAPLAAMIIAVFEDFPGKSGETISVSAPLQIAELLPWNWQPLEATRAAA
jgi:hypothetical protein